MARIERELESADGGVYRYLGDTYYGGGQWLLLTAALGGRTCGGVRLVTVRAASTLAWIERQAGPDGTLPEQVATNALHPGACR